MRVGMIVHAYYLKDARVRRYAELLAREGHEVDVICLNEGRETESTRHLGVGIHRIDLGRTRGGQLSYVYEYLNAFVQFWLKLRELEKGQGPYDIMHVHNMPDFLVYCAARQKRRGAKIILDIHDLMPEVYQSKYGLGGDHWLTRSLCHEERVSVKFASAVITANHAFADILEARGFPRSKIDVIMNSADSKFFLTREERTAFRLKKDKNEFHVIYVGTMAPRYGLEHAVAAVARLHRGGQIPGLRFSIMPKISNEGDYVRKIVDQVRDAGLSDRFRLLEPVPHDAMPGVFAGADALIYTPLPDIHTDIALSLKIPEAIAAGCPVVAAKLSVNMRYFGEDSLFMFEPGDIEGCAARLLEVYRNPAQVVEKLADGRLRLGEFAWEKQAQVYLELIHRLWRERAARNGTLR